MKNNHIILIFFIIGALGGLFAAGNHALAAGTIENFTYPNGELLGNDNWSSGDAGYFSVLNHQLHGVCSPCPSGGKVVKKTGLVINSSSQNMVFSWNAYLSSQSSTTGIALNFRNAAGNIVFRALFGKQAGAQNSYLFFNANNSGSANIIFYTPAPILDAWHIFRVEIDWINNRIRGNFDNNQASDWRNMDNNPTEISSMRIAQNNETYENPAVNFYLDNISYKNGTLTGPMINFILPGSATDDLVANAVAVITDPGTWILLVVCGGVPLGFWIGHKFLGLFPRE